MKKIAKISKEYLALGIIIILIILLSLIDLNKTSTKNGVATQKVQQEKIIEKEENNVTVIVEYLPEKSDAKTNTFQISLDTHSVNLDSFDPNSQITLEKENKTIKPQNATPEGSGHHRKFDIVFENIETPFTIVITNLADIPKREFTFTNLN